MTLGHFDSFEVPNSHFAEWYRDLPPGSHQLLTSVRACYAAVILGFPEVAMASVYQAEGK